MPRGVKVSDTKIIEALKNSGGVITYAAQSLGIQRSTISIRIHNSPKLEALLDEIIEQNLDIAENQLLKKIERGNMTAIIFYLKTKGKSRGYVERYEKHDMTEAELNAEIERQLARLAGTSEAAIPGEAKGAK